jgi:IS5 family transposase
VIEMRPAHISFSDGLIAEEVSDLREGWMEHPDRVLADEQIVAAVYEALARRHPKSRSRGRLGAPAETVLRLLILKHIRNWSYGWLRSTGWQRGAECAYTPLAIRRQKKLHESF